MSARLSRLRLWAMASVVYGMVNGSLRAESFFESRYQYYQEEQHRIRVDSNYSLFSLDLKDSVVIDGSFLYSTISGASPIGFPPFVKGSGVFVARVKDERTAFTLGVTKPIADHALKAGISYSYESDYTSLGYSLQDTISFNQKNTELVLGMAFTDDVVGANGSSLASKKRSYDVVIGVNQVLTPTDLLSFNVTLGWRQGYLNDPYKAVLLNSSTAQNDLRPERKFEQLALLQWTHYLKSLGASVESSYRFGRNDWGSCSHTAQLAVHKKLFHNRVVLSPSFRYYRQTAADFYATEFFGNPSYCSSDYRLSAEETFSLGMQMRWYAIRERLALDIGYERYVTRGLDGKTSQSAYPSANSVTVGVHYQF
ncbi:MAG: DUF3570 domain-containing protein [Verrucomicrobiota bacterium]